MHGAPSGEAICMLRSRSIVLSGVVAATLLFAGCAAGEQPPTKNPEPQATAGDSKTGSDDSKADSNTTQTSAEGEATFTVNDREFTVALAMCSVYPSGEILMHGPAQETDSDVVGYFDGDVSQLDGTSFGTFRINIGSTGKFQSSDDFYAFGNAMGGSMEITEIGSSYQVVAAAWDGNGTDLGEADMVFRCAN